jgi:hypothetical protein
MNNDIVGISIIVLIGALIALVLLYSRIKNKQAIQYEYIQDDVEDEEFTHLVQWTKTQDLKRRKQNK